MSFQECTIASFDCWDTLLTRKCHPDEIKLIHSRWVWLQIQEQHRAEWSPQKIYRLRKETEDKIANEDWEYRFSEVAEKMLETIDFGNNHPTPTINQFENAELNIEVELTELHPQGYELLKSAKENCIKLILISDFYHSSVWIHKLLEAKGITCFENVFSSSDNLTTKRSGQLYKYIMNKLNIKPEEWIHIGDNKYADIERAQEHGLSTILIDRNKLDPFYKRKQLGLQSMLVSGANVIHDIRIEKIVNLEISNAKNRFKEHGIKETHKNTELFSAGCRASKALAGFILKIIEDAQGIKSNYIHFFSREGIFFKELYDIAIEEDVYMLNTYKLSNVLAVSRVATLCPSIRKVSLNEFMRIWNLYSSQSIHALCKTLGIEDKELEIQELYDKPTREIIQYPWQNESIIKLFKNDKFMEILEGSIADKKNKIDNYLKINNCDPSLMEDMHIVDIGWRGTIQDNLCYLMENKKILGTYFGLEKVLNEQPANSQKTGYIGNNNTNKIEDNYSFGDFAIFEFICNVSGGSVVGYESDGTVNRKVVEGEESVIQQEGAVIQLGIKTAIRSIFKYIKCTGLYANTMKEKARETIDDLKTNPNSSLADAFNKLEHNEIFGTGAADKLLEISSLGDLENKSTDKIHERLSFLWNKSRWKPSLTKSTELIELLNENSASRLSMPIEMHKHIYKDLIGVKIIILAPHPIFGSGGHRTIFNLAKGLIKSGANVEIQLESFNEALEYVKNEMRGYNHKLTEFWQPGSVCDIAIATISYSVEFIYKEINAIKKYYFNQDYEAAFNPVSDGYVMCENSYNYGLSTLNVGSWLPHLQHNQHGQTHFYYAGLGSDPKLYHYKGEPKRNQIAFLYQPEKHRRLAQYCQKALILAQKKEPSMHVVSYGSDSKPDLPFEFEHLGLVSDLGRLNSLYNHSKVGLCISLTNPSRIPFEMMRAGCVPIDVFRYNNLFDYQSGTGMLVYQNPESISSAILELLSNSSDFNYRMNNCIEFSRTRTLDWEIDFLANAVNYSWNHEETLVQEIPKPTYFDNAIINNDNVDIGFAENFCKWQLHLAESFIKT